MTIWHAVSLAGLALSAWAGFQSARDYLGRPEHDDESLPHSYLRRLTLTLAAFCTAVLLGLTVFGIVQDGFTQAMGYSLMIFFWALAWFAWAMAGIVLSSVLLWPLQSRAPETVLTTTTTVLPPLVLLGIFVPMLTG
jgi:hypothetical protein